MWVFVSVIDAPDGFLTEWWSIFWDTYNSRPPSHPGVNEGSSSQATQMMVDGQPNIFPMVPQPDMPQQRTEKLPMGTNFDNMPAHSPANLLGANLYEQEHLGLPPADLGSSIQTLDVDKLSLTRGSSSSVSHHQRQTSSKAQQRAARDDRHATELGKSKARDSTLYRVPEAIHPSPGVSDAGKDKRFNTQSYKGLPLTGIDSVYPGIEHQVLNSLDQVPNQYQQFQTLAAPQQHDILSQVLVQTPVTATPSLPGITGNFAKPMLPKGPSKGKDGRISRRQKAEQQPLVPLRRSTEQQTMVPMRQAAEQQQSQENSRKRKNSSNSLAGESSLGGGVAEVDKTLDDNVENFLSPGDDTADVSASFSTLRRSSSACENECKGFSFEEVGSLHSSKSKVLCCHFSSDGKLVASAGHEKKILIWNTQTFDFISTAEGHSHIVTDIRFRSNSTILATSSFDKTVQIWDAAKPSKPLFKLLGHAEHVMSVDFHPRKLDLLCSCDGNDEIRLWSVNQSVCTRISKGASRHVRFQPRTGNLLAAAGGNVISLIDVETNSLQYYLKGHARDVRSICWDTSGKYIASVSEESARVWSVGAGGKCVYELHCSGNKFESCTFHPGYSQLLVIGSYQSLELWNPTESSRTLTVHAHNGIIAALADSPQNEMIASASHDQWVKLWK